MNRTLIAASVIVAASLASMAASPTMQDPKPDPALAKQEEELAAKGEETTERVCGQCHGVEEVASRRSSREWSDTVTAMADRGAIATADELALIKRYMARYYGLIAVNTASAEDFSAVLGLSAKDAERIVEYRKKNGKFADAAALLSVPEIDRMKIEAQREALRFN